MQQIDDVRVVGVACDEAAGSRRLATRARTLNLPLIASAILNERAGVSAVRTLSADLALNVNSLVVFGEELRRLFPLGAVNFHPGPLPEYAGLHVHQWAIINGETQHGVTFHMMERRIDAGDVLASAPVPIYAPDTGLKLFMRCIQSGVELIDPVVRGLLRGTLEPKRQDLTRRRYYGQQQAGFEIRFEWPARRIVDLVRALDYTPFQSPLGSAWLRIGERTYTVQRVRLADGVGGHPGALVGWSEREEPILACGDGGSVVVESLNCDGHPQSPRQLFAMLSARARQ